MLGYFTPDTGYIFSSGTPSGRKNRGYQAFDRKRYNYVPMYCKAHGGCQPIELIFEFTEAKVRCDEHRLYAAEDIPVDQKPVSWTLSCGKNYKDAWITLDTVTNFDWFSTEIYKKILDYNPVCWNYLITLHAPLDAEGGMTATISELELRAYGTPPPTPTPAPTPTPDAF